MKLHEIFKMIDDGKFTKFRHSSWVDEHKYIVWERSLEYFIQYNSKPDSQTKINFCPKDFFLDGWEEYVELYDIMDALKHLKSGGKIKSCDYLTLLEMDENGEIFFIDSKNRKLEYGMHINLHKKEWMLL